MPAVAEVSLFEYKQAAKLMGNRFEITVVGNDESLARERITLAIGEIRRIEKLLTTFDEGSLINEINRQAGIQPVQVGSEVFELVKRSLTIIIGSILQKIPDYNECKKMCNGTGPVGVGYVIPAGCFLPHGEGIPEKQVE